MFEQPSAVAAAAREGSDSAPIIDLVDLVVNSAITSRASDVHIEPMEKGVLVRHRLDGLLKEVMDLPKWVHEGLVARMKIMAGMDIAEKRLPQDGRLRIKTEDGKDVDFRVSTLRTLFGEKIVLRVLDHRKGAPPLEELGLAAAIDGGGAVLPPPPARDDPGRRSDRQRQDDDPELRHHARSSRGARTSSRSKIRSSIRFPASTRRRSTRRRS